MIQSARSKSCETMLFELVEVKEEIDIIGDADTEVHVKPDLLDEGNPVPSGDVESSGRTDAGQTGTLTEELCAHPPILSSEQNPLGTAQVAPPPPYEDILNFVEIEIKEINLGAIKDETFQESSRRAPEGHKKPCVNHTSTASKFFCPQCHFLTRREGRYKKHLARHRRRELRMVPEEVFVKTEALVEDQKVHSAGPSDSTPASAPEVAARLQVKEEQEAFAENAAHGLVEGGPAPFVEIEITDEIFSMSGHEVPVNVQVKSEGEDCSETANKDPIQADPEMFLKIELNGEPVILTLNKFSASSFQRRKNTIGKSCSGVTSKQAFQYFCPTCSFRTNSKCRFRRHLATHKVVEKSMACMLCNFTTNSRRGFQTHVALHKRPRKYKKLSLTCSICRFETDRRDVFSEHLSTHDNDTDRPIKCPLCPYRTHREFLLRNHSVLHNVDGKKFACPYCTYETNYQRNIQSHLNTYHVETKQPFLCDACGYKTHRKSAYSRHLLTHNPDRPRPHGCPHCPYRSDRRHHLQVHIRTHYRDGTYSPNSTHGLSRKRNTKIHIETAKYECQNCDYTTDERDVYIRHWMAHVKRRKE